MCYFLTVAVPIQYGDLIEGVFQSEFQTIIGTNPTVTDALPANYVTRVVTTGFCSCELYSQPGRPRPEQLAEQLQRKYEKRGWSQAKIQRAVEQAVQSQARFPASAGGIREDVIERLQVLAESAGAVGVFAHWYGGNLESELLELKQFATCNLADLNRLAAQLPEDQLLLADSRRVV